MFRTPRDIETSFRKSLGAIGPLMCVADIATHELVNKRSDDELSKLTKKYKHKRLNLSQIDLGDVALYVNLAHIAYINSRAESFCADVVRYSKENSKVSESFNIDSVDFLRRSVFLVYARNNGLKKTTTSLAESIYIDFVGENELLVIDYYRRLRNVEFHGGVDGEAVPPLDQQQIDAIRTIYNFSPNKFSKLSIRDVILYSQAWQTAAKRLCSKVVKIDNDLLGKILCKYVNDDDVRRRNALRQKLKQDYLQSDDVINILESNGWVA